MLANILFLTWVFSPEILSSCLDVHFLFLRPPQVILSQSQDKALRRIGELREVWLYVMNVVVSPGQYLSSFLIKVFRMSEHVEWSLGASNGPAGQETPTGRVWCCAGGERPDDNCAPNTGEDMDGDVDVFCLCGAKSAAVGFGIYSWLINKEIEIIKKTEEVKCIQFNCRDQHKHKQ